MRTAERKGLLHGCAQPLSIMGADRCEQGDVGEVFYAGIRPLPGQLGFSVVY